MRRSRTRHVLLQKYSAGSVESSCCWWQGDDVTHYCSQTLPLSRIATHPPCYAVCGLCCGKHSCPVHPSQSEEAERCICEICNCTFHHCPVHSKPPAKGDTTHRIHYPEHPLPERPVLPREDPANDGVPFLGRTTYESHYPGHAVRAKQPVAAPLAVIAPHAVPLSTEHRDGYLRHAPRPHGEGRKHVRGEERRGGCSWPTHVHLPSHPSPTTGHAASGPRRRSPRRTHDDPA
jgi:hypothetical protein